MFVCLLNERRKHTNKPRRKANNEGTHKKGASKQTHKQTNKQTNKQANKNKQTNKQTCLLEEANKQADRRRKTKGVLGRKETHKQTNRETNKQSKCFVCLFKKERKKETMNNKKRAGNQTCQERQNESNKQENRIRKEN